MTNPYLDDDATPTPPAPRVRPFPWVGVALFVGLLGCFLPQQQSCTLPIPVPPFVEPVVDPAQTEGSWVLVIEETADRTPFITSVLGDKLWQGLESRGLKWRHYDDDSADAKPYAGIVAEVGLPVLLIVDAKGKVLAKQPLPATADKLDEAIRKATGR